jgi:hypothetical protein
LSWAVAPGDIFWREVGYNGALGAVVTLCNDGLEQNAPVIAATAAGAATVAWRDSRGAGTNTGIFAAGVTTSSITAPFLGVANGTMMQMLSWSGPPSDPLYGAPVSFEIRTSDTAIDDTNWDGATSVTTMAVNGPPGTYYCTSVWSLALCTTYHYAIRTSYTNSSGQSEPVKSRSGKTKCSGGIVIDCESGPFSQREAESTPLPTVLEFSPARPNPARDGAHFELAIPAGHEGEDVRLAIFDLLGRQVREVLHEPARAGRRPVEWRLDTDSGTKVPSGMYFARLRIGDRTFTHTVIAQP